MLFWTNFQLPHLCSNKSWSPLCNGRILGGGWTNPCQKHAHQIGSFARVIIEKKNETTTKEGFLKNGTQLTPRCNQEALERPWILSFCRETNPGDQVVKLKKKQETVLLSMTSFEAEIYQLMALRCLPPSKLPPAEIRAYVAALKTLLTFHYTGCLMTGSLFHGLWNNPHITGLYFIPYIL